MAVVLHAVAMTLNFTVPYGIEIVFVLLIAVNS